MFDTKNVTHYWLAPAYRSKMTLPGLKIIIKMSSVMPFTFNAVELCVVTINEKPWIRDREVCRALEYDAKTSKTANIIKAHCSQENINQKYQMSSVHAACTQINLPKDSQKYYI